MLKKFLAGVLALASLGGLAFGEDKYPNYAELKKHEREGVDYRIRATDRESPVTVFAIHGGGIEPATSELAHEIAGTEYNEYLFEGLKPGDNQTLHITSTHFDEETALRLALHSTQCVSIHGFAETESMKACVGGGNERLRSAVADMLKEDGFPIVVEVPCGGSLAGAHPKNIVNRCREKGVQIELSVPLCKALLSQPDFRAGFAKSIRKVLTRFK